MSLRVLHLIDSGGLYGAEKMLLELVAEQLRAGLAPMILSAGACGTPAKALEREAMRRGLPITPWRMRPGFNLKATRDIIDWARGEYDLLHSHGYKFNILLAATPSRLRPCPVVATLHGYVRARFPSWMWLYEALDRFVLGRLDGVVVVDPGMERIPAVRRLPAEKRRVIPNGLNEKPRESSVPLPAGLERFTEDHSPCLVALGRLSPEKGFDVLLEAFAAATRGRSGRPGLVIMGEGGLASRLTALAESLGVADAVHFPGYVENADALLRRFDGLVISSRTEGLPVTLLEAMRQGLPVITTRVGAIPTVVQADSDTPCAWLLPPGDVAALSEVLEAYMFEASNEAKRNTARRARLRFEQAYGARAMEAGYDRCYRQVLGVPAVPREPA